MPLRPNRSWWSSSTRNTPQRTGRGPTTTTARRRALFEPLEGRINPASGDLDLNSLLQLDGASNGAISVTLTNGNLALADVGGTTVDHQVTVRRVGADFVISNAAAIFQSAPDGGALSDANRTLTLPITAVTGSFTFDAGSGDDTLSVDLSEGDAIPLGGIYFNGGSQSGGAGDQLIITGGSTTTVTHTFFNANDGSVALAGAIDGTIHYTGLEPVIDDVSATDRHFTFTGGAETITVTDSVAGDGKTLIDSTLGESVYFTNPTVGLTINAGTGDDVVTITSVDAGYHAALTINGGVGNDVINLNGDISFASGAAFDVDLQNDDVAPGADSILIAASANLVLSGNGSATLRAGRNIAFALNGSIETASGNIIVEANQQTSPASGNFNGVELNGGLLSSVSGNITVRGRGGISTSSDNEGVYLRGSQGQIISGSGSVLIEGTGGGSGGSNSNYGVYLLSGSKVSGGSTTVRGVGGNPTGSGGGNYGVIVEQSDALLTSTAGAVLVEGTGGGGGGSGNNYGVYAFGGVINTTGSTASVTVRGIGGNTTGTAGSDDYGVFIRGSTGKVAAVGGPVIVEGTGGGAGISTANHGVYLFSGGTLSTSAANAAATITVNGVGGNTTGTGDGNYGVYIENSFSTITTNGAAISVTGISGGGATSSAIVVGNTGLITATAANSPVTLTGDSINLQTPTSINAVGNIVTLQPRTAGTLVNVGGADVLTGSPLTLGLTTAELDRVVAGTMVIGRSTAGPLTVSTNVTRSAATNIELASGGDVILNPGQVSTNGGTLLLNPGVSPAAARPQRAGVDAVASLLSFNTGDSLGIVINGTTVDSQYTQLSVSGQVNLIGAGLALSGSYQPAAGDTFILIANDGSDAVLGTFTGLPQNSLLTVNGGSVVKRLTYAGGDGNDVALVPFVNSAPVITSNGGGNSAAISVMDGVSNVTTVTATDPDLQTLTYSISGGADQARLTIHPTTGVLQFVTAPDYFAPSDAGGNNVYDVVVRVDDGAGGSDTQNIAVTVTNLISIANQKDLVYDPVRNQLLVTRSTGQLVKFDAVTGSQLASINTGVLLNAADITADGNWLYVAEGNFTLGGRLYKVNLNTNAVTTIPYSVGAFEAGGWDLAIDSNGIAWFDGEFAGSGAVPLRQLNTATDVISPSGISDLMEGTHITRAGNRSRFLYQQNNINSGPIFQYTPAGGFTPGRDTYNFQSGNMAALNATGSMIALEFGSLLTVFDSNYQAVEQFLGLAGGVAFHPTQNLMLAVDPDNDQLVALDMTTWREAYRLPIGENVGDSSPLSQGVTAVSPDGSRLYLSTPNGIRVIRLPAATGTAANVTLEGYGTYVRVDQTTNVTVTIRDAAGNVVPNYTGTVRFTSTDVAAGLPANYTFTLGDAGSHTFPVTFHTAGNQTITATDTVSAALTRTTATIQVHAAQTAVLPVTGARDLVFDSLRNRLYVTTTSGNLQRYDVASDSLLGAWRVGTTLNGADITGDNQSLYAVEGQRNAMQGMVRQVNLSTGQVTPRLFNAGALENGGWDIAIAADGQGLFTQRFAGSGATPLREINTATNAITTSVRGDIFQDSHVTRGVDRSRLFLQQSNLSSGPIFHYTSNGTYSPNRDTFLFQGSVNSAVSPNGQLIATEVNSAVVIFDSNYTAIEQLYGFTGGMYFHPTQPLLLVIDAVNDQIVAFDTTRWEERYRISIGENVGDSSPLGAGVMTTNADGSSLYLATASGVRMLTLPAASGVASRIELQSYSSYVNVGAGASLTVTVRDPAGNLIPGYTGTVRFSSTDRDAGLPAQYTFTAADAGSHTFTVRFTSSGNQTITVTDTTNALLTRTTGAIQVHATPTAILPITGARDLVFDATRNQLHVTTTSGAIQRYDLRTDSLLPSLDVGAWLSAADITSNGGALYVQETIRNAVQTMTRKVDLTTGQVTNFPYDRSSLEGGGWDLAIAANGLAIFDSSFEGSGAVPLRQINTTTDILSTAARTTVNESTHIVRNRNRSLFLLMESDISSGPISTYDGVNNTFSASTNLNRFLTGTFAAINDAGTRIALAHDNRTIEIRDANRALLTTISSAYGGLAFRPGTNQLYVANADTSQIRVYDGDNNWSLINTFAVGETLSSVSPIGNGTLAFDNSGSRLFLVTATGVRTYLISAPMYVTSSIPTNTGVRLNFSKAAAIPGILNLYDYRNTAGDNVMGAADVQLVGQSGGPVQGSLIVNSGDAGFTFVSTNGQLPPDNYTLTLRSAADGFQTTTGEWLDGNADGIAGGDYVTTFQIAQPTASTVTVSLPNFARGPQQAVNVPEGTGLGIPLTVSGGANLVAMTFDVLFDSGLLNITDFTFAPGVTGTKNFSFPSAGRATVTLSFASPLTGGQQTVVYMTANVPSTAASRYGERGVLDLTNITLTASGSVSVPAIDQDGAFANSYFGDVSRDGIYNSFDVQQASRAAVGLDSGYQQHLLLDPRIVSDFDSAGGINSFDVQRISRLAVGLAISEAPPLPIPPVTVSSTGKLTADDPPPDKTAVTDPISPSPSAPQHNPAPGLRSDVDDDGVVDAQDILWAIYLYNQSRGDTLSLAGVAPANLFADVNGDNQIDPADILFAVSDFNLQSTGEGESPQATSSDVPAGAENLASDNEADSLLYLLATDVASGKKRK